MKTKFLSEFNKCFEKKGFWLYEVLNKILMKNKNKSKIKTFIFLFILPPIIVFLPELIMRFDIVSKFSFWTIISLVFAGMWSLIGPLCIYSFHEKIIGFSKKIYSIEEIPEANVKDIFSKVLKNLNRNSNIIGLLWTIIVLAILIINPSCMDAYGFNGFQDIYFVLLLIYIIFMLNLTACGFYLVIVTVRIIIEFSKRGNIIQNILENHQLGIKIFGGLSFCATIYFSTGLLYLPILIDFCRVNNFGTTNIIFIPIFIYILFLLYAYIYPNVKICLIAMKKKEKLLEEFNDIYMDCIQKIDKKSLIEEQVYMINVHNTIVYLKELNVYPTNVKNVIMIFSTIIFPVILFFIDKIDIFFEPIMTLF